MTKNSTATKLLHLLPPEPAHNLALWALRSNLLPAQKMEYKLALAQNIFGLQFKNPVGIAAGFDKNAVAVNPLLKQGFGFVEAGTVTPLPQDGNPKPRIFRLPEDEAVINRLGFNNNGLEVFIKNFTKHNKKLGIAGANIGKNKDTINAADDYVKGVHAVYPFADYITINISSPNTKGLRDLQNAKALAELLTEIIKARNEAKKKYNKIVPLLLKIAPDIDSGEREDIAQIITEKQIDGLIVSNTTISRPETLASINLKETGGLSGCPLFAMSNQVLSDMYRLTDGKIPIIGVGGIASPQDAYTKIRNGASLVQLYTALIYQGLSLVRSINNELPQLLARDGFKHISEAIGVDC